MYQLNYIYKIYMYMHMYLMLYIIKINFSKITCSSICDLLDHISKIIEDIEQDDRVERP